MPRLHEQYFNDKFSLTSQGQIARVDWEKWTLFPCQGKATKQGFPALTRENVQFWHLLVYADNKKNVAREPKLIKENLLVVYTSKKILLMKIC